MCVVWQIQVYEDKMRKLQQELKRMQELNKATDEEVSASYGDSTHVSLQAEAAVPESRSKAGPSEHAGD